MPLYQIAMLCYLMAPHYLFTSSNQTSHKRSKILFTCNDIHQAQAPLSTIRFSHVMRELTTQSIYSESQTTTNNASNERLYTINLSANYQHLAPYLNIFAYWLTIMSRYAMQSSRQQLQTLLQSPEKISIRPINEQNIVPLLILSDLFVVPRLTAMFSRKCAHLINTHKLRITDLPTHLQIPIAKEYYLVFEKILPGYAEKTRFSLKELYQAKKICSAQEHQKHYTLTNALLMTITKLPSQIFPTTLTTLNLSHNHLAWLPEELKHYSALKTIILKKNNWSIMSDQTLPLPPSITSVDLSYNVINYLDPVFLARLKNLTRLNLAHNKFTAQELVTLKAMQPITIMLDAQTFSSQELSTKIKQPNITLSYQK